MAVPIVFFFAYVYKAGSFVSAYFKVLDVKVVLKLNVVSNNLTHQFYETFPNVLKNRTEMFLGYPV